MGSHSVTPIVERSVVFVSVCVLGTRVSSATTNLNAVWGLTQVGPSLKESSIRWVSRSDESVRIRER